MTKYRIIEHRCSNGISTFWIEAHLGWLGWWREYEGDKYRRQPVKHHSLEGARMWIREALRKEAVTCESIVHEP